MNSHFSTTDCAFLRSQLLELRFCENEYPSFSNYAESTKGRFMYIYDLAIDMCVKLYMYRDKNLEDPEELENLRVEFHFCLGQIEGYINSLSLIFRGRGIETTGFCEDGFIGYLGMDCKAYHIPYFITSMQRIRSTIQTMHGE